MSASKASDQHYCIVCLAYFFFSINLSEERRKGKMAGETDRTLRSVMSGRGNVLRSFHSVRVLAWLAVVVKQLCLLSSTRRTSWLLGQSSTPHVVQIPHECFQIINFVMTCSSIQLMRLKYHGSISFYQEYCGGADSCSCLWLDCMISTTSFYQVSNQWVGGVVTLAVVL